MKEGKKWYKSITNWLVIVGCVILVPILVINLWIMFQSATNNEKVPSVFGIKPFIVLSGSMESDIHKGDLILTKEIDPSKLKVEDIIAFRDAQNTVTTHRIIDVVVNDGITYFITKGDNNITQDQNLVAMEDVEGIYVGRIPGIGSIMNTLSEPVTIIVLLFGITLIFAFGFMISNKKQRDLERKEFLEYKMMKEKEEKEKAEAEKTTTSVKTKKTKSIKAEEKETPKKKTGSTKKSSTSKPNSKSKKA